MLHHDVRGNHASTQPTLLLIGSDAGCHLTDIQLTR